MKQLEVDDSNNVMIPSLLNGPVYLPNSKRLTENRRSKVQINTISKKDPFAEDMLANIMEEFDINSDLSYEEKKAVSNIIYQYQHVFVSSLSEIKTLNYDPYTIVLKPNAKGY